MIRDFYETHLSWSGGVGLRSWSVFLLKVSGSILPSINLDGLVYVRLCKQSYELHTLSM